MDLLYGDGPLNQGVSTVTMSSLRQFGRVTVAALVLLAALAVPAVVGAQEVAVPGAQDTETHRPGGEVNLVLPPICRPPWRAS